MMVLRRQTRPSARRRHARRTMTLIVLAAILFCVPLVSAFAPSSVSSFPISPSVSVSTLIQQQPKEEFFLQKGSRTVRENTYLLAFQRHQSTPTGRSSSGDSNRSCRVGIAGAGAVALGTAALLARAGHDPMIWSPSGRSTVAFDRSRTGNAPQLISTGALERTCPLRIAHSARELVYANEVLLVALPANGHKAVLDQLAPHLADTSNGQQHVIISSHASMGALYLQKLLHERGVVDTPVTAWGTTVVTARREQDDKEHYPRTVVRINTVRKSVDVCTVPADQTISGLELCSSLFPGVDFRPRDGLLAISLSNLNPQNHLGMALCNFSRMEKGEAWQQSLYVTPKVGKYLEALDAERLAIASALGVSVRTIFEHFHLSFHVEMRDNISDMCQDIYLEGRDVLGPATADTRYVTEDAPFGLALTVVLGNLVQRPAVLHQAGLAILSSMYERDFFEDNDLLKALDLKNVNLDQLKQAARTGRLENQRTLARRDVYIK